MAVVTFIIDHVVTEKGDMVPVYCREEHLYLKLDDVPKEHYKGLKGFIEKYPETRLSPEWEGDSLCLEPYEFMFLVGGTYCGTLDKYMPRLSHLQYEIREMKN